MPTPRCDPAVLHAEFDALDEATLRRRRTMKWATHPADVLPAWVAEMDYPIAPALRAAAHDVLDRDDHGYPRHEGLAEAFAGWADRELGWTVDPALATPVADVMAGIEIALLAFTEPGDGVVVLTPAYPPFFTLLADRGRRLVACPLVDGPAGWEIDVERLAAALDEAPVLLLCHPHNPTGRVWSPMELATIAALVEARGGRVISDEIHAPLRALTTAFTPYAACDERAAAHTVTLTSVSKAWNVPGVKGALLAAQPGTAEVATTVDERERVRASVIGTAMAVAAWTDDGGWLDATRAYLDRTRARVAQWAADTPGVRLHPAEGGYLSWLDVRESTLVAADALHDPADLLLERSRVAVNAGHTFAFPPAEGHGFLRLNHATSLPLLDRVLDRLGHGLTSSTALPPG